jgi:FkbM family methyltransferase
VNRPWSARNVLRNAKRGLIDLLTKERLRDNRFLYTAWEANHLRRLLADLGVDCVFDIGANRGQYAEMLRRDVHYRGLIISFEPMPGAASELRAKAAGSSDWSIEEVAIGGESGQQAFNIMVKDQFSSLSQPSDAETTLFQGLNRVKETVTVAVERLDAAFHRLQKQHGFTRPFLKMDTQGYDIRIVTASPDATRQFLGIQTELSVKRLYEASAHISESLDAYERLGFELSALVPNNAGHYPKLVECDGILLRRDLTIEPRQDSPH